MGKAPAFMNADYISPDSPGYPAQVQQAFDGKPLPTITALGNLKLLNSRPLAFYCSIKCPGDVILQTYDLILALRDAGIPMIGGFHSPMEKECLTLLLRGTQPVIVCPARSIDGIRLPAAWKKPITDGRLLILSTFARKHRRVSAETSQLRNLFVAVLAEQILVAHAGPGSKTQGFFQELLTWHKPIWTLPSKENDNLLDSGAQALQNEHIGRLCRRADTHV